MANSMRVKIKKKFLSPLDNRMCEVDSEMSVPQNQFWLKRIELGDCFEIEKQKAKVEPKVHPKQEETKAPATAKKTKGSK